MINMQLQDKIVSGVPYGMKRGVFGMWKSRAQGEPASQRLPVKQPLREKRLPKGLFLKEMRFSILVSREKLNMNCY